MLNPAKLIKLPREFYQDNVLTVAPKLLGKMFVKQNKYSMLAGIIVEIEAYDGNSDEAAHTFGGKTTRNEVMFNDGGYLYVYFTYGMHYCCNVVTGKRNSGQACLIRALEPVVGLGEMNKNRFGKLDNINTHNLTNGPAKLCSAFDINKKQNGIDLCGDEIYICDYKDINPGLIRTSERIGIKKSVDLPWRFFIDQNRFVSKNPSRKKQS